MKNLSNIRPEYKPVKEMKPHCPNCGERLSGNNSMLYPYKCSCGEWKRNMDELTFKIQGEE